MKNRRGFTLVEILIVVAVIAVLIAIAIPLFAANAQKAREAVCTANCRSFQDELFTDYMMDDSPAEVERLYQADKAKYTCPLGGTMTYKIVSGVVTVSCSHAGQSDPLGDAAKMQGLLGQLSALRKTGAYYNSKSSAADIKLITDALKAVGVDLSNLTTWALRFDGGGYPKLYWSSEDVSQITNGTAYMMAYTLTTGHYTVWKANVSGGVVTGETNGGLQNPDVNDQNYQYALAQYKQLTGQ